MVREGVKNKKKAGFFLLVLASIISSFIVSYGVMLFLWNVVFKGFSAQIKVVLILLVTLLVIAVLNIILIKKDRERGAF